MKVFAIVLLCAFAAVQGRGIDHPVAVKNDASVARPGEVHLRIAVSTSGQLQTCLGVIINNQWVLTASSCVEISRFVWVRYDAETVWKPKLVIEASVTDANQNARWNGVVGLVRTRYVEASETIAPYGVSLTVPASGTLCSYGEQNGQPGENRSCSAVSLSAEGDNYSSDAAVSQFDVGAGLESGGEVSAILINANGDFTSIAGHLAWINQETGLSLGQ